VLCKYWNECQPEVMANCCRNDGIWKDKRRKNYGQICQLFKDIDHQAEVEETVRE